MTGFLPAFGRQETGWRDFVIFVYFVDSLKDGET